MSPLLNTTSSLRHNRNGFTLLELMLVLTILVLLGAIAAPRLTDVFERQKLNGSANNLRLAWDEARLEAMRTGQAQVFQCELGTNRYTVKPLVLQSDITNAGTGATVMTGAGTLVETDQSGFYSAADTQELTDAKTLEDSVEFVSCLVSGDMRAYSVAQDAQASNNMEVSTMTVNQQILFYPDGSTSTAEVQLKNKRGDSRAVRMRGLTGHTQIVVVKNVSSDSEQTGETSNDS